MGCTLLACLSCSSRCSNSVNHEIHLAMWCLRVEGESDSWSLQPSTFFYISFDQIPPLHLSSSSLSLIFKLLSIPFDSLLAFPSLSVSHLGLPFPLHPSKSHHSSLPLLPLSALFLSCLSLLHLLLSPSAVCQFWLKAHFIPALPLPFSCLSSPVVLFLLFLSSLTSMASGSWVKHCLTEHTGSLVYLAAG